MAKSSVFFKSPLWLVIIVLISGAMACNLARSSEVSTKDPLLGDTGTGGGDNSDNTTPPTVQIFTPQDGQQVFANNTVDVRVNAQHPTGVQRIQMKVDDRIVSSKSLLDNPTNVDVLLTWTPDRSGSFTLQVQAFTGSVGSNEITVTLQVFPEGAILSNPAGGQPVQETPSSGVCNARIVISNLNMRSGPGTSFAKQGSFDTGETVSVVGRNTDSQNREWFKIRRSDSSQAWVINNTEWVELSGSCSSLPTVN